MIKFIATSGMSGDCTTAYDVELDKPYTVGSFIDMVLSQFKGEWGYIKIPKSFSRCEYRYGNIVSSQIDKNLMDREVERVTASGGWSSMDYILTLK